MGFVLLGVSTLTPVGVNAALFANIAHGLITGLLFFLVGAMKQRYGSTDLEVIAGARGGSLYGRAPRLGGLLAFGAVAGLGLPGLAGFWGEMLALFAAFDPAAALDRSTYLVLMAAAGFGTLLTAAYLLLMVRRVCMGPGAEAEPDGSPVRPTDASFADASRLELTVWSPLVALTVLAGLWPAVLLGLTEPSVTYRLFGG
jgi:NADH-quinone oxidoreductase subunit M